MTVWVGREDVATFPIKVVMLTFVIHVRVFIIRENKCYTYTGAVLFCFACVIGLLY